MKVYVVVYYGMGDHQNVEKVFSSLEKAEEFVESQGRGWQSEIHMYDVEEHEVR